MGKTIFKLAEHQTIFDKQGFIILPFLTEIEINTLSNYFDETHPNLIENNFVSDSYSSDFNFKKKASDKIVDVFNRAYEKYFIDYTPFGGSFLYKTPGNKSSLAAHQDWTIVNEETDIALNCWVPLCDITLENGPIMIMPGSQYSKHNTLRAPTLPFFFSGNEDLIMEQLEPILVNAGTAIILNQSVIHYSPANESNQIRKAITAGVKSANAQMYFHFKIPNENKLEVFKENDEFLISFENFMKDIAERPKLGESVGMVNYEQQSYNREELKKLVHQLKTDAGYEVKLSGQNTSSKSVKQVSFFTQIKSFFKL
jgi:hypothetical protein